MRNRFVAALFLTALLAVPAFAEVATGPRAKFGFNPLWMRNTSAASVAREPNWVKGGPGSPPVGYVDSTVFSVGAATATDRDTSAAFHTSSFALPPHVATSGTGGTTALLDSVWAGRLPWIAIRVRQDTTSYSFSGTSTMDSVYVAAQFSYDGINWINVNGTPTVAFEVTNGAAGEDGTVPTLIGPYAESNAGQDAATAFLDCVPSQRPINNSYILNRTLCMAEGWVRFLLNMDGKGQYAVEIGSWKDYE